MRRFVVLALVWVVGPLVASCTGGEVADPLRVDALHPTSESENVWIRDPVWVRFSEQVDPATVTPARVVVSSAMASGCG